MAFPTTQDNLPTNYVTGNVLPASTINAIDAAISAIETKLGLSASSPTTTGQVLTVTGTGTTAWQTISASGGSSSATSLQSVAISATAPTAGQVLSASSSTAASWVNLTQIPPRVVTATYAATLTPNSATTDIFRVILTGNATIALPSGTPFDGQALEMHIIQDSTGSRTLTFASGFNFGTAGVPTLTTTPSKTDVLGFRWSASTSQWRFYGIGAGF